MLSCAVQRMEAKDCKEEEEEAWKVAIVPVIRLIDDTPLTWTLTHLSSPCIARGFIG